MAASASASLPALSSTTASSGAYQLVVIAKPSPGHPYQQLASVIQSCPCAQSILNPCLKALRALSDESNRAGILQELKFAADYNVGGADVTTPADDFYQTTDRKDADCRFPYIAATLVSSMATCCLDQGHYGYDCSLETPFHAVKAGPLLVTTGDTLYEDCGTDSAITVGVVDITNPDEPRYCFLNMDKKCIKCGLWWHGLVNDTIMDDLALWETTDYTPLSCDTLLQILDVGSDTAVSSQSEARGVEASEALRVLPVVDSSALASCWSAKAWNSMGQLDAYSIDASASSRDMASSRGAKSLSELSQERILDAILTGHLDDLDLLNEPMLFRGFLQSFLSLCAKRVDELAVFEDQELIAELLARLLEGIDHVDLYPFRVLPIGTILLTLHSDRLKGLTTINLSGLFDGCPEMIWTALDNLTTRPEVVYLLSPPSADKASDEEAVLDSFPPNTWWNTFWDRMGPTKIIMSAAISAAVVSHCSNRPSTTLGQKQISISHLREILSGDTLRLQKLPHTTWFERNIFGWPALP
ncbi:hypothetical protein KVR01_006622 [Diaporthe batatas]|uniref:uncharacterized protein n=1 Tax=Diaporthe batatas TaxID=748121 RepID=UPI001D0384B4|nr:uncharacterized protein KVR01_006622 [Diaporthe batatas]KAG8163325.1 hypothetical protein KVR01_006622 [Diaporthe batatas]